MRISITSLLKLISAVLVPAITLLLSCDSNKTTSRKNGFSYKAFRDSLRTKNHNSAYDSTNIFDTTTFIPGIDSLDTFLEKMDAVLHRDEMMMEQMDSLMKRLKKEETFPAAEKLQIRENIRMIDSFFANRETVAKSSCREKECFLYTLVIKSKQLLYLYLDGELRDSFPVSTGKKGFTTPDLNGKPSGPIFAKYTSRKFPGGNYKGLGNMPYAVFVRGGYAIHGTTPGNFTRLGTVASHGCIRLHPDNARLYYELSKLFGLNNSWVTVRDSL
ncbi:MAG: L,D-transpeptidase [Bacteroidota bacterium]